MLVLALDTATPAVTAGVVLLEDARPPRVLARCVTLDAKAHGELLAPHIRDALADAGAWLPEVSALVCGVGPGPFTGLRAGMVTAAALGHGLGVPVYPVCSLDAIAAECGFHQALPNESHIQQQSRPEGHRLLVATDARRKEVYWAAYDEAGARVTGPEVTRPAELAETLPQLNVTRGAGSGARLYADVLGLPLTDPEYPSPAGLVTAARAALLAGDPPAPLVPLYLRRPDATEPGARKRVSQL